MNQSVTFFLLLMAETSALPKPLCFLIAQLQDAGARTPKMRKMPRKSAAELSKNAMVLIPQMFLPLKVERTPLINLCELFTFSPVGSNDKFKEIVSFFLFSFYCFVFIFSYSFHHMTNYIVKFPFNFKLNLKKK